MRRPKAKLRPLFAVLLIGALAACAREGRKSPGDPAGEDLGLASAAFAEGGPIPARYTADGANVSPPLAWHAGPPGTESFVLWIDDPDAPGGTFTHWVLWNRRAPYLPEAVPPQPELPDGTRQGRNSFGRIGYGGPAPPAGTHRYVFRVLALDTLLDVPAGAELSTVLAAARGHELARGERTGLYARR